MTVTDRDVDRIHEKLDKLEEKMDNILDMLRDHHGRISQLEATGGTIKTGLILLIPVIMKLIYDLAKAI